MRVGMLWFDDDKKRTLAEKVERAVTYYAEKYRTTPSVCYVNPAALEDTKPKENGVAVRAAATVRPNHFWVGVEEKVKSNGHRKA